MIIKSSEHSRPNGVKRTLRFYRYFLTIAHKQYFIYLPSVTKIFVSIVIPQNTCFFFFSYPKWEISALDIKLTYQPFAIKYLIYLISNIKTAAAVGAAPACKMGGNKGQHCARAISLWESLRYFRNW